MFLLLSYIFFWYVMKREVFKAYILLQNQLFRAKNMFFNLIIYMPISYHSIHPHSNGGGHFFKLPEWGGEIKNHGKDRFPGGGWPFSRKQNNIWQKFKRFEQISACSSYYFLQFLFFNIPIVYIFANSFCCLYNKIHK